MADSAQNPVVLVHGIWDTQAVFRSMRRYLEDRGWSVHSLDLKPNNGNVGLDRLAQQVADYVAHHFAPTQAIDLVGFSMGGIVSRYYLQRLGGINQVQRFVAISAPHYGSQWARLQFNPGCEHLRPNSPFLQDLNQTLDQLASLAVTSIWTPYDLMIIPAQSSHLPLGHEVTLPVLTHAWMLTDPRSLAAIATALSTPVQ